MRVSEAQVERMFHVFGRVTTYPRASFRDDAADAQAFLHANGGIPGISERQRKGAARAAKRSIIL